MSKRTGPAAFSEGRLVACVPTVIGSRQLDTTTDYHPVAQMDQDPRLC